jgi:hypothetical protein
MPTHQQIVLRMHGFVRRANKWRFSLGSAAVWGIVIAVALVTMLTFDWPHVGGDAAIGQGSFIGGRSTVIDGDTVHWQGRTVLCLSEIKLAHTDDEVRREMTSAQCGQRHESCAVTAHSLLTDRCVRA